MTYDEWKSVDPADACETRPTDPGPCCPTCGDPVAKLNAFCCTECAVECWAECTGFQGPQEAA